MPDGSTPGRPLRGRPGFFSAPRFAPGDWASVPDDAFPVDEDGWASTRPPRQLCDDLPEPADGTGIDAGLDRTAGAPPAERAEALAGLRRQVWRLEGRGGGAAGTAPLGLAAVDGALPGGGLARACLHEVAGPLGDAAAAGFAASAAAALHGAAEGRAAGPVLWLCRGAVPYAPGLAAHGLTPDRLLIAQAADDTDFLWALEEAARSGALAAVVGDAGRDADAGPGDDRGRPRQPAIDLTASRRLQLACEAGGTAMILLRPLPAAALAGPGLSATGGGWSDAPPARLPPGFPAELAKHATAAGGASVAATRWHVVARPSRPTTLPGGGAEPGVGVPAWRLELVRNRGGRPGAWEVTWDLRHGGLALLDPRTPARAANAA